MSTAKLACALFATTALVGASFAQPGNSEGDHHAGMMESHDSAGMPAQPCRGHKHHTEALDTGVQATGAVQPTKPPPLWDNLGSLTWKITTKSDTAQNYFNQGLRLTYAFNHGEARRSFRAAGAAIRAARCATGARRWCSGPIVNYPMQPGAVEPAFAASAKAQVLSAATSPKEQALIRALAKRYSPDPSADRHTLDAPMPMR